ncbi:uncharacterized protein [Narcine bancroftii]|uniref:uncharacterized protein isoform X5 n=1 Tax=Narcine bancroftii TaxID=1343680 RepID=UPI0038312C27
MSPFGQEMMYFNTSPSIHPITGSWATGSITNVDKGQHCLVERVKLNISEICPFVTILAKGFLYKALTQKSLQRRCWVKLRRQRLDAYLAKRLGIAENTKRGTEKIMKQTEVPLN